MKKSKDKVVRNNFESLALSIVETDRYFLNQVQRQVNAALTVRNWVIGQYVFKYEQKGEDRALYGNNLYSKLAKDLKEKGARGLSASYLYTCKDLYLFYPQIFDVLPQGLKSADLQNEKISKTKSGKSKELAPTPPDILINRLSFSHFLELIKQRDPLNRLFYETAAINNNWSVRELQRAIESKLFERTGQSDNKKSIIEVQQKGTGVSPEHFMRDPYVLEFLNIEDRVPVDESTLEAAIIDHLQSFIMEMGKGFCFEERQKRITLDNTHFRVDLVFYHRILKCHVLIDIKMRKFSPGDVGQMNLYLNYFKKHEMQSGDEDPIGLILCADKSETVAKYATTGVSQNMFIAKYLTQLPTIQQLQEFIEQEQSKQE